MGLHRLMRDNLRLFLIVAVLYYTGNLWHLLSSKIDATSNRDLVGDFPVGLGGFAARWNHSIPTKTAGKEIEDVAKGSLFGFPGFRILAEDAVESTDVGSDGKGQSLPSLAQIDQASVVLKRGTKVYLDYLRPVEAPRREEFTVAIVVTISELRQIFALDRPPWAGPISCAIQVSEIVQDTNTISSIVNENPAAFDHTSIHLLISEAMMVVDWSSAWTVTFKASRTDLVMAISEPATSLTEQLDEIGSTVKEHYVLSLKLQKTIIRINGDGESEALLFSKRGALLPMPNADTKTRHNSIIEWTEQLRGVGFAVDTMFWHELASTDDIIHQKKFKPVLLEMGSMNVVGLNETVRGSLDQSKNLRAFTNFVTPKRKFGRDDVSLVTQMAFNKRERLVKLASAWGGIMSVAVFLSLTQVEGLVRFIRNNHVLLRFCSFHLVIYESMVSLYPINIMRNVASDAVETDYIFTVDIDFMPSLAAHDTIRSYLTHSFWGNQVRDTRAAMVIPAFEYTVSDRSEPELFGSLPLTRTELIRSNDAIPFHLNHFFAGQKPTDYERWYKAEQPYEVHFEEKYEPYVVLCARGHSLIPRYWDGFVGYRLNKASWIKELFRAGWRFYVMSGEAFVIHMYHDISNRPMMHFQKLYNEEKKFEDYLKERYAGTYDEGASLA